MQTVGVICEYNPFHLGHARQFAAIRHQLGQDAAIVCLMSGNYVQRGEPAVFDKLTRARAAADAGLAPDDAAAALGMKPYAVKKNLTLAGKVPPAVLRRALELCRDTDGLVKRVSRDKQLTAEVFVLQLTGLLRGARV